MLRCSCSAVASYLGFGTLQFSGSPRVNDPFWGALYPSKSGLINKHTVKHTVKCPTRYQGSGGTNARKCLGETIDLLAGLKVCPVTPVS